jgi:ribonuclease HI
VAELTCKTCGGAFSLPAAVLAKYPGWTPSVCLPCRDRARRDGPDGPDGTRGKPEARGHGKRAGRSVTAARTLTPQEVLDRFTEGPETGVFTDGGASPNPGPGGWGLVWVDRGQIRAEASGTESHTTNNRMELTALIEAFRLLPAGEELTVHSDSELCVRTINEWAPKWERAGWKRKTGPIQNLDLVQELLALSRGHPGCRLLWVRAHSGWLWNEYADALASAAIARARS